MLAPRRNISEFFSSLSYYNIAFLYLRDDTANVEEEGADIPFRRFVSAGKIGSFSQILLVANRQDTQRSYIRLILTATFR